MGVRAQILVMPKPPPLGASQRDIDQWAARAGEILCDAELEMDDAVDRSWLRPIWTEKTSGWQEHRRQFIRLGICTETEFKAALKASS